MRLAILLSVLAVASPLAVRADPPAKEADVVRPVLWWSDLNRVSDGGGPAFKSTTSCITDAKAFAKAWDMLGTKRALPKVNFMDYFVVVVFRAEGVDFELTGGLVTDPKGNAKVVGRAAHHIVTNAGWYSTTIGVFPRKGIASVEGHKLPAVE